MAIFSITLRGGVILEELILRMSLSGMQYSIIYSLQRFSADLQKVASGAAEVIPLIMVTNLSRTILRLQELGVWVVGTSGDASTSIYELDLRGASMLVMGSENAGLRELTKKHCDFLAKIPMLGDVESLNVSVAAGVTLFEVVRQRGT